MNRPKNVYKIAPNRCHWECAKNGSRVLRYRIEDVWEYLYHTRLSVADGIYGGYCLWVLGFCKELNWSFIKQSHRYIRSANWLIILDAGYHSIVRVYILNLVVYLVRLNIKFKLVVIFYYQNRIVEVEVTDEDILCRRLNINLEIEGEKTHHTKIRL